MREKRRSICGSIGFIRGRNAKNEGQVCVERRVLAFFCVWGTALWGISNCH